MDKVFKKLSFHFKKIKKNVSLKKYSSFRIGGRARYFLKVEDFNTLIEALLFAQKIKLPYFILGGGTNVLISDSGFDGLLIKNEISKITSFSERPFSKTILLTSGTKLSSFLEFSLENGLEGGEFLAGIPGTVGGAIFSNSGAFSKSISEIVEEVEVFDLKKKEKINFLKKDCRFKYRDSIFKKDPFKIILSVKVFLKKGEKKDVKKRISSYLNERKKSQPLSSKTVGCIFKNPSELISAGYLIEKAGLKGKRIGRVKISQKHANFIINLGNGKAREVLALIKKAKNEVKKKFGIDLVEEINYLGSIR